MKSYLLLVVAMGFSLLLTAQSVPDGEYKIDASERQGNSSNDHSSRRISLANGILEGGSLVVINGQRYKSSILPKFLADAGDNKNIVSIDVLKDEVDVRSYTTDPAIKNVIRCKVSKKLARRLKKENPLYLLD